MKLLPLLSLCLLSWSAATFGDQHGSKVIKVGDGNDVILPCSLSTNIELSLFEWKKDGQKDVFVYNGGIYEEGFNGRVSHFPDELKNGDASIKIRQTVLDDSGNYICSFPNLQPSQIVHIQLVVEPFKVIVMEDRDAILPCSLGSESTMFDWRKDYQKDGSKDVFMYDGKKQDLLRQSEQFRGRVSHFPDELKNGNASIKITETKLADGGNYTCIFPYPQPERKFNIELVVGAAPEPYIRINQTKDRALLQCEVKKASPRPEVMWQDSDGHNISTEEPKVFQTGDRFCVTLNTTVTKTGRYRCVVTQKEIHHRIHAETSVYINGAAPEPSVTILKTEDGVLLQCFVRGASPKPQLQWQDSDGNLVPAKDPQVSERGGSYDIILQATVTKTDTYRCVVTQEEINHQTQAETYANVNDVMVNGGDFSRPTPQLGVKVCRLCAAWRRSLWLLELMGRGSVKSAARMRAVVVFVEKVEQAKQLVQTASLSGARLSRCCRSLPLKSLCQMFLLSSVMLSEQRAVQTWEGGLSH